MIQPLHIARKDARHLWPELALHTALLVAFAWLSQLPRQYTGAEASPLVSVSLFFVRVLIPILWLVITSRLIHDESLVGDQQFWITRPYTWPNLLGAKVLFLAAFVWLPFLVMQAIMLAVVGINPFFAIPSLLLNLLYLILISFLPFFALASVTSTFPRLALAIMGSILLLLTGTAGTTYLIGNKTQTSAVGTALATLLVLLLAGIVVFQYATRRTLRSRLALAEAFLLIAVLLLIIPAGPFFRHSYPVEPTAKLAFDPNPLRQEAQLGRTAVLNHGVLVNIPTHLTGLDSKAELQPAGLTYTLDAPGIHYVAPWQNGMPGSIRVPETLLASLGAGSAHLHLSIAANRIVPGTPQVVNAGEHFTAPGHGACTFPADGTGDAPRCNFPFHAPILEISAPLAPAPCTRYDASQAGQMRTTTFHLRAGINMPVALDPVAEQRLEPNGLGAGFLCPGAPLTFTPYQPGPRTRFEVDIPSIQLSAYVVHIHLQHPGSMAPSLPEPMTP